MFINGVNNLIYIITYKVNNAAITICPLSFQELSDTILIYFLNTPSVIVFPRYVSKYCVINAIYILTQNTILKMLYLVLFVNNAIFHTAPKQWICKEQKQLSVSGLFM